MNCESARPLFPEYWEGSIDEADRLILQAHFDKCAGCRSEAEELRSIWTGLAGMSPEAPSDQMRIRFYDRLDSYRQGLAERPQRRSWFEWIRLPAPAFGLALALLGVGFAVGYGIDFRKDNTQLSQLRSEVSNMRQLVALSLMQQQNATDRLQGVNWTYRVERSDTEVLGALLNTINHDESVNVRLAAIDAMRKFGDSPIARRGLAQAIFKQDSPLVQISLIDQLVELRDSQARSALDTLVGQAAVNPEVRQRAQWALSKLQ